MSNGRPAPPVPREVEIETAARAFLAAFDRWTMRRPQPPWPATELEQLRLALNTRTTENG